MKQAAFLCLLIASLGIGCAPTSQPPAPKAAESIAPIESPTYEIVTHTSSTEGRVTINVTMPRMTAGLTEEARTIFNDELARGATRTVDLFRQDFTSSTLEDLPDDYLTPWTLQVEGVLPTSTGRIQSALESGYQYTGGAHGLAFITSKMFDLETGKFITLGDLFEADAAPLSQLETLSREDLMTREYVMDDPDWVNLGTAATSTNYTTVYAVPEGLVVEFGDYQVVAHAAGPQTVVIPWEKLKGVKEEYRR